MEQALGNKAIRTITRGLKKAVRAGIVAAVGLSPALLLSACIFSQTQIQVLDLSMGTLAYNKQTKNISWEKVKDADYYQVSVQKKGDENSNNSFQTNETEFSMSQEETGEYTISVKAGNKAAKKESAIPAELTIQHAIARKIPDPENITVDDLISLIIEKLRESSEEYGQFFIHDKFLGFSIDSTEETLLVSLSQKDSASSRYYIVECLFPVEKVSSLKELYQNIEASETVDTGLYGRIETLPSPVMEAIISKGLIDNLNRDESPASLDKLNYYSWSNIYSDRTYYYFNLYVANDQSFGLYEVMFLPLNGEYYNSHDELFANVVEYPERLKIKTIGVSPLISLEDYQWPQNAANIE